MFISILKKCGEYSIYWDHWFSCIGRGMTSALGFGSIIVCKFLAFPNLLSYPYRMLPDQRRCKFFRLWEMQRSWNVQAGAGWRWVVSMVAVVYQMSLFVLRIENSTLLWRPTKKCYICLLKFNWHENFYSGVKDVIFCQTLYLISTSLIIFQLIFFSLLRLP